MMKVQTIHHLELTPKQLAEALVAGTPKEFGEVWYRLYELMSNRFINECAEAMSEYHGSNRKRPLMDICERMHYFEIAEQRKTNPEYFGDSDE